MRIRLWRRNNWMTAIIKELLPVFVITAMIMAPFWLIPIGVLIAWMIEIIAANLGISAAIAAVVFSLFFCEQ